MRSVEAKAKTRKEAIQKALDELAVELHEVEIEILDEGSRGLFGIGARDVHVRVATETGAPPPKSQRPPHRDGDQPRHAERSRGPERPRAQQRPQRDSEPRRPNEAKKEPEQRREAPPKRTPERVRERAPETPLTPLPETTVNEAAALLAEVIQRMGVEVKVTATQSDDGAVRLQVESPDSALLIGRKGRNLEALQYLINRMALPRDSNETADRLVVDIENYQDRRRESLEQMALQLARRAKDTGREVRVKPLSPQERRIIHLTLQDDPDVRTFSTGESILRTVVIAPKNAEGRPGGDRPRRPRGGGGGRSRRGGGPPRGPRPERPAADG